MRSNALWNCKNPNQGPMKRVLCVCSAGLLRSPTIAWIMSNNGYNTRAAGVHDYALVKVDDILLKWADLVVCADQHHADILRVNHPDVECIVLRIPDQFQFRDPALCRIIEERLKELKLI